MANSVASLFTLSVGTWYDPVLLSMNAVLFCGVLVAWFYAPRTMLGNSFILYNFAVRDVTPLWHFEKYGKKDDRDAASLNISGYLARHGSLSQARRGRSEDHCEIMDCPAQQRSPHCPDYVPGKMVAVAQVCRNWEVYNTKTATLSPSEGERALRRAFRVVPDLPSKRQLREQLLQCRSYECRLCGETTTVTAADHFMLLSRLAARGVKTPPVSSALIQPPAQLPKKQTHLRA
eukprot:gene451-894_t